MTRSGFSALSTARSRSLYAAEPSPGSGGSATVDGTSALRARWSAIASRLSDRTSVTFAWTWPLARRSGSAWRLDPLPEARTATRKVTLPPPSPGKTQRAQRTLRNNRLGGLCALCVCPCWRWRSSDRLLMPERPLPAEHHGDAVPVGGGDDLVVADGAAGLAGGCDARPGRLVDAVAERGERVRRHAAALDA